MIGFGKYVVSDFRNEFAQVKAEASARQRATYLQNRERWEQRKALGSVGGTQATVGLRLHTVCMTHGLGVFAPGTNGIGAQAMRGGDAAKHEQPHASSDIPTADIQPILERLEHMAMRLKHGITFDEPIEGM